MIDPTEYRDVKLILVEKRDACKICGATRVRGALRRVDDSVVIWCADSRCRGSRSAANRDKLRNIHNWPDVAAPRPKTPSRDGRFVVPDDRREYVFARDACCVHCDEPLSEMVSTTDVLEEWRAETGRPVVADPILLPMEMPGAPRPFGPQAPRYAALANRPIRVKRKREIDHLVPYWAGIRMADRLEARAVDIIGTIAVVGSCPPCNSRRQVRSEDGQLMNRATADNELVRLHRLFVDRILIDPDVDPIVDVRHFSDALEQLRAFLTEGLERRVSGGETR